MTGHLRFLIFILITQISAQISIDPVQGIGAIPICGVSALFPDFIECYLARTFAVDG